MLKRTGREHEDSRDRGAARRRLGPEAPAAPTGARAANAQRAVGNRALAPRARRSAGVGGAVLQRKGQISTIVDSIVAKWLDFEEGTRLVQGILFGEVLPLLKSHTKAAGKTKHLAKTRFHPLTLDPDKARALQVGHGFDAWVFSATQGADRYYAELRGAVALEGPPSLLWQFGVSDITEPDIHTLSCRAVEVKHTTDEKPAAVDKFIREARDQVCQRITTPDGRPYKEWVIFVELTSSENPWPFTPTEAGRKGVEPRDIPHYAQGNSAECIARVRDRNLAPTLKVPDAQSGKHRLIVSWPKATPPVRIDTVLWEARAGRSPSGRIRRSRQPRRSPY